jgi:2-iminobutanoate/2-iminopropanoate deaminase
MVVDDVVLLSSVTCERSSDDATPLRHEVTAQTEGIVARLEETLAAAGTDLEHLVKTQVFLSDLELFHRYDRAWKRSLPALPPRTTTQTGDHGFLAPGALVSIDAVAVLP